MDISEKHCCALNIFRLAVYSIMNVVYVSMGLSNGSARNNNKTKHYLNRC